VEKAQEFQYNGVWFLKRGIYDILEPPDIIVTSLLAGIDGKLLLGF
jgi:hypothetical protein